MYSTQGKTSGVVLFAVVGLLVAAGIFFAFFITTQKANTPNPRQNLRIPVPTIPPRATLTPVVRPSSTPVESIGTESAEPTAETTEETPTQPSL